METKIQTNQKSPKRVKNTLAIAGFSLFLLSLVALFILQEAFGINLELYSRTALIIRKICIVVLYAGLMFSIIFLFLKSFSSE